jgi:hypothetical protein
VSVTMANRRLIARHATWTARYRVGRDREVFHQEITCTQARTGTIVPATRGPLRTTAVSHRRGQNHSRATSPWFEKPAPAAATA